MSNESSSAIDVARYVFEHGREVGIYKDDVQRHEGCLATTSSFLALALKTLDRQAQQEFRETVGDVGSEFAKLLFENLDKRPSVHYEAGVREGLDSLYDIFEEISIPDSK